MKLLRNIIFWCHLSTAAAAALVILTMSVTGVLLTYERQIIAWADTRASGAVPVPAGAPPPQRASIENLLARVQQEETAQPTALTVRADPTAPVEISFGRERTLFLDPYTGQIRGDGAPGVRGFFHTVTDWHRWLGAKGENREAARAVTGACNLCFLFLIVSGFYLWWPRNWNRRAIRNVTLFQPRLSPKARDFNWHNVLGFWGAIPLFIIVVSATVISYPWASDLVYRLSGETPPPPRRGPRGSPPGGGGGRPGDKSRRPDLVSLANLDQLWGQAERQVSGWRSISLRLPESPDDPLAFTIDQGTGGQPQKRGQLTLNRMTGEVVRWEPFSSGSPGRRLRSLLRFAHTGEVWGIAGQTLAGLASAAGAVLVWTGLALTWRRWRAWKKRRARGRDSAGGDESSSLYQERSGDVY